MLTKVKKVYPDSKMPTQGHPEDAGWDLYVHHFEESKTHLTVYTGIAIQAEPGYFYDLYPRSSISKKELILCNSVGVIDPNYRGEIVAKFRKMSEYQPGEVKPGDRLVQMVAKKKIDVTMQEVSELDETTRGCGGFGSTGKA